MARFRQRLIERLVLFVAEDAATPGAAKNASLRRSLRNALKGLTLTFLTGRNFRIELAFLALAVVAGIVLRITAVEWIAVIQSATLVLALEAKNTAIELSVDLSTSQYHYHAKGSKDSASGAVLLAALAAVAVGGIVFGPRLVRLVVSVGSVVTAMAAGAPPPAG